MVKGFLLVPGRGAGSSGLSASAWDLPVGPSWLHQIRSLHSADQAIGDWTIVRFASGQQDGDQSMIAERGVLLIE